MTATLKSNNNKNNNNNNDNNSNDKLLRYYQYDFVLFRDLFLSKTENKPLKYRIALDTNGKTEYHLINGISIVEDLIKCKNNKGNNKHKLVRVFVNTADYAICLVNIRDKIYDPRVVWGNNIRIYNAKAMSKKIVKSNTSMHIWLGNEKGFIDKPRVFMDVCIKI